MLWSDEVYRLVFEHWAEDKDFAELRWVSEVTEALSKNPESFGESRARGRVGVFHKSTVFYEINSEHRVVRIFDVRFWESRS